MDPPVPAPSSVKSLFASLQNETGETNSPSRGKGQLRRRRLKEQAAATFGFQGCVSSGCFFPSRTGVFWLLSALRRRGAVCCLGTCQVISVLQRDHKISTVLTGISL